MIEAKTLDSNLLAFLIFSAAISENGTAGELNTRPFRAFSLSMNCKWIAAACSSVGSKVSLSTSSFSFSSQRALCRQFDFVLFAPGMSHRGRNERKSKREKRPPSAPTILLGTIPAASRKSVEKQAILAAAQHTFQLVNLTANNVFLSLCVLHANVRGGRH